MSGHLTYFCCCRFFQKLFNHCRPPTTPYYCTGFPFRLLKWFPRCLGDVLMLWSWKNEASCSSAAEIKLMLPFYVGFYLKKKSKIGRFNNTAVRLLVYLDFVKSIEQELKIQWEYRSHRNFDFKRPYLGNGTKFWKIEENKVQLFFDFESR